MPALASCPPVHLFSRSAGVVVRGWQWLGAGVAILGLTVAGTAAEPAAEDFGKDIQLAPFVVKGKSLAVSIHARTKSDRRYAEKFAEDVVEIAYETMGNSTGRGLIIVGADGEPHPIHFFRKFLEMAKAGQLDPSLADAVGEVDGMLTKVQEKMKIEEDPDKPMGITFDTFVPALPLHLKDASAKLYQLAWAEGFDGKREEKMLKSLTRADLTRDELARYDWVFYLPPHSTTSVVLKEVLKKGMAAEKMGILARAAIRSAVFTFRPAINKAVEGMRKGMLFSAILHAVSPYDEGDIDALTRAYAQELMPDLTPGSVGERRRALEAIEKQKVANAEYAKDPFVSPARLATFDPAAYAPFEGEYGVKLGKDGKPGKPRRVLTRQDDAYVWQKPDSKPRLFYPAGERLLVSADGKTTLEFKVDETGAVTGVEGRWERGRDTISRKAEVQEPATASAKSAAKGKR